MIVYTTGLPFVDDISQRARAKRKLLRCSKMPSKDLNGVLTPFTEIEKLSKNPRQVIPLRKRKRESRLATIEEEASARLTDRKEF